MNGINYQRYIPLVLFILLVVLAFFLIRPFLLTLFLSALLAYLFYPLYTFIFKKSKNRTLSALIICVLVMLIIVLPATFLIKTLVEESYVLYIGAKQKLSGELFANCDHYLCQSLTTFIQDPEINYRAQELIRAVTNFIIDKGSEFLLSVPRILINLVVLFFTLFYLLVDGQTFLNEVGHHLGIGKQRYTLLLERLKEVIGGVVFGYLFVAIIQGMLGALGFFIFGISSPILWGVIMALLALIPVVGTGLVWIPASAILVLDGMFQNSNSLIFKGVALFVYCLIFVGSLDNIIRPKLMSGRAKIHPVFILLGSLGGLFLFGPLGIIFGPLVLSLVVVLVELYKSYNSERLVQKLK
ncbi:MAG TPA: AI-2E family transporter [Candidatus Nanoarchaeia archaeon]|nr:AI-2E family transporter [Candidatus Nanoarchaeia archaeon]